MVAGKQGLYQQINIQKKPLTVQQFNELANSDRLVLLLVMSTLRSF